MQGLGWYRIMCHWGAYHQRYNSALLGASTRPYHMGLGYVKPAGGHYKYCSDE